MGVRVDLVRRGGMLLGLLSRGREAERRRAVGPRPASPLWVWVWGFGVWGFGVWGFGFWVQGLEMRIQEQRRDKAVAGVVSMAGRPLSSEYGTHKTVKARFWP